MKPQYQRDKESVRRARPRKGISKFLKGKVKTFNAHINEFEDDTASSTVVRWLVVVLLLHLVFIGGVSLHGFLVRNRNNNTTDIPAIAQTSTPVASQPVADAPGITTGQSLVAAPVTPVAQAVTDTDRIDPVGQPVNDIPPASTAKPGAARHLVATGDSWETIARDNGCSVADLKSVNPGARLTSGVTLIIPMSPEEEIIPVAEEVTGEETDEQLYTVKKGDTLSKIARQYKVSVDKLQKHNNITDPRKIRINQQIRIPVH